MPDVPVSLVRWRDAKADPPEEIGWYWTDKGALYCYEKLWLDGEEVPTQLFPSVWCDPSPPDGDDPLGADDLQHVLMAAEAWGRTVNWLDTPGKGWHADAVARLRRALEAIGDQNT